ncbi:MAG: hypothetical protein IJ806_06015 [Ruminococcus sp.]|nr:hypothetical protein [Ruminococcus sp.]
MKKYLAIVLLAALALSSCGTSGAAGKADEEKNNAAQVNEITAQAESSVPQFVEITTDYLPQGYRSEDRELIMAVDEFYQNVLENYQVKAHEQPEGCSAAGDDMKLAMPSRKDMYLGFLPDGTPYVQIGLDKYYEVEGLSELRSCVKEHLKSADGSSKP